jgi:hypothetical protein
MLGGDGLIPQAVTWYILQNLSITDWWLYHMLVDRALIVRLNVGQNACLHFIHLLESSCIW